MTGRADLLQRLLRRDGKFGLEAAGDVADLSDGRQTESLDQLELALRSGGADPEPVERLLQSARDGLAELARGGALSDADLRIGVEAIILADGSRPCVLVQDDRVNSAEPTLGNWAANVHQGPSRIAAIARATARITLPGADGAWVIGTGFAIGSGRVATNRHVLQLIATPDAAAPGGWAFLPGAVVDFCGEHDRAAKPERQFAPLSVHFAGPDLIGEAADPALLDLAVIDIQSNGLSDFPDTVQIADGDDGLRHGGQIAVLGFPAAPAFGSVLDVVLYKLFRNVFGVKRFAPGFVTLLPGKVAGDHDPPRCFGHDASTLGGNSGSCIFDIAGVWQVVGLHFGGSAQINNYAHAVARIAEYMG